MVTKTTSAKPVEKPAAKPRATKAALAKPAATTERKPRVTKPKPIAAETTIKDHAQKIAGQATDMAREKAKEGISKTGDALDKFASAFADSAKSLDKNFGKTYGDYARKAADATTGAASSVKEKSVDELLEVARDFIKTKPLIAAGAAAAVGFALIRLFRAGGEDTDG